MFEISQYENGDPFKTIKLDRESRKYINVWARQLSYFYNDSGDLSWNDTYYKMRKCDE